MSHSAVYNRVAASAAGRRGYSDELHGRVDNLVQEFLNGTGRNVVGIWPERRRRCDEFVRDRYWNSYGNPLLFLMWPVVSALISWLVQKTLDELFCGQGGD